MPTTTYVKKGEFYYFLAVTRLGISPPCSLINYASQNSAIVINFWLFPRMCGTVLIPVKTLVLAVWGHMKRLRADSRIGPVVKCGRRG